MSKLKQISKVQITANFRSLLKGINTNLDIGVSINLINELLDLDLAGQKMSWDDIQAALKAYQEKRKYFVLQNGMLAKTEQPTIEKLAQTLHDLDINFKDFIHGKLQHQKVGFNWLSTVGNYNFGGLLADEMGLGKTLQIIALLLARKEQTSHKLPNLIVAPASVIYNWQAEVKRFAPDLRVALFR
nr:SNF2-related protein [uncultured Lactobacillus sp.]